MAIATILLPSAYFKKFDEIHFYLPAVTALLLFQLATSLSFKKDMFAILKIGLIASLIVTTVNYFSFSQNLAYCIISLLFIVFNYKSLPSISMQNLVLFVLIFLGVLNRANVPEVLQILSYQLTGIVLALIAVLVSYQRYKNKIILLADNCLTSLEKMAAFLFAFYSDESGKPINFDKRFHSLQVDFFHNKNQLLLACDRKGKFVENAIQLYKCIDNMGALLSSMSLLRLRVHDRATLDVPQREFADLKKNLVDCLQQLKGGLHKDVIKLDMKNLQQVISDFDYLQQNTLQMIAHHPLDFVIFSKDLASLQNECDKFFSFTDFHLSHSPQGER